MKQGNSHMRSSKKKGGKKSPPLAGNRLRNVVNQLSKRPSASKGGGYGHE